MESLFRNAGFLLIHFVKVVQFQCGIGFITPIDAVRYGQDGSTQRGDFLIVFQGKIGVYLPLQNTDVLGIQGILLTHQLLEVAAMVYYSLILFGDKQIRGGIALTGRSVIDMGRLVFFMVLFPTFHISQQMADAGQFGIDISVLLVEESLTHFRIAFHSVQQLLTLQTYLQGVFQPVVVNQVSHLHPIEIGKHRLAQFIFPAIQQGDCLIEKLIPFLFQ